ncbi:MAG: tRNA threonylcarbamoyladenosine dehydratase [Clostridia bacterium]|nr:tRNA threonylcarbamoyladenosine dehydratase [Clostridia bacterium]
MDSWKSRTETLIGKENVDKLSRAHVLVFGLGGVGSYCVEALARAGIGELTLVDGDKVSESNINRQLIATVRAVGRQKAEVQKERVLDINPNAVVHAKEIFYLPENSDEFDFSKYDYVVDAVDTVSAKIEIITRAKKVGVPVISSMGTGNKLEPTLFKVSDISKTKVCPLAKVMRKELKERNVTGVKVLYSEEEPVKKERIPASISFVPSVAGLIICGEVIKDIISKE